MVDAAELASVLGDDAVDVDDAGAAVAGAVAAAADHLAVILGVKVVDVQRAAAVELENLVRGTEGTTTVDGGGTGRMLEGGGVLADVRPPDIVQGASSCVSCDAGVDEMRTYQVPLQ